MSDFQVTRCDLCNVDFTSAQMAESHVSGKQHLQRLKVSFNTAFPHIDG